MWVFVVVKNEFGSLERERELSPCTHINQQKRVALGCFRKFLYSRYMTPKYNQSGTSIIEVCTKKCFPLVNNVGVLFLWCPYKSFKGQLSSRLPRRHYTAFVCLKWLVSLCSYSGAINCHSTPPKTSLGYKV